MKMSQNLLALMNEQISYEIATAYLYLNLAAYCRYENWLGAMHWLQIQWNEELDHAEAFFNHINLRNEKVVLSVIPHIQKKEWTSLLDVFQNTYNAEQAVSESIVKMQQLAIQEHDIASLTFLEGFIDEQVSEEKQTLDIVRDLERAGEDISALLFIDKDLGQRKETDK